MNTENGTGGIERAIERVGSVRKLARQLQVERSTVRWWRQHGVPPKRAIEVARLTGVSLHELRPDLW